jgi:hypothetical protein
MRDDELFTNTGLGYVRHPANTAPYVDDLVKVTKDGVPHRVMYGRPSNFASQIEDRFGIQKWSERRVLQGSLLLDGNVRRAILDLDLDDTTERQLADGWVIDAKEAAGAFVSARRGTFVHEATMLDRNEADPLLTVQYHGEDLGMSTETVDAILDAWGRLLERHGLSVLAIEQPVVDDRWRLAGSLDRIVRLEHELRFGRQRIPAGTVVILDIKTGRLTLEQGHPQFWNGHSVQIASYAHSVPYVMEINDDGERVEYRDVWPWPIDQRHALIAHIDVANAVTEGVATAQLLHVDLVAGLRAGNLARQARDWQSSRAIFALHDEAPVATTVGAEPF